MIFKKSTQHLNSVCMSYFEHSYLSMYFSVNLLVGSGKAFVHAWVPCWFTTSTSDLINNFKIIIDNVGCEKLNKPKSK